MFYHDYLDMCVDEEFEPEAMVPVNRHADAGDALLAVMEKLYNSARSFDAEGLRRDLAYLCESLQVSNELLRDPNGICVEHYAAQSKRQEVEKENFNDIMSRIRQATDVLKRQLCGEDHIDYDLAQTALKRICWEAGCPMQWGMRVQIQRKPTEFKSEFFDTAINLLQKKVI